MTKKLIKEAKRLQKLAGIKIIEATKKSPWDDEEDVQINDPQDDDFVDIGLDDEPEPVKQPTKGKSDPWVEPSVAVRKTVGKPQNIEDKVVGLAQQLADSGNVERFGDLALILSVWENLPKEVRPSLEKFKEILLSAQRQGKIKLTRSDMAHHVLDKGRVQASQIAVYTHNREYPAAEFHLIEPTVRNINY